MTNGVFLTDEIPGNSSYSVNADETKMNQYATMAKNFMNKPFGHPHDVVGNFGWHEKFPYEECLTSKIVDGKLTPVVPLDGTLIAIDFGCGPGRMVNRFTNKKWFRRVDGIDVSDYALDYARKTYTNSNFFISSGIDVGDSPHDTYDFLYSTIAIQHISCWSIREKLYKHFSEILKKDAKLCLQLAYNPTYKAGVWSPDTHHASYRDDYFDARGTNGHADMVINSNDLDNLREDFEKHFTDVSFTFAEVASLYQNLNGEYHAPYWASHWIFVHATNGKKA